LLRGYELRYISSILNKTSYSFYFDINIFIYGKDMWWKMINWFEVFRLTLVIITIILSIDYYMDKDYDLPVKVIDFEDWKNKDTEISFVKILLCVIIFILIKLIITRMILMVK